MEKKLNFVEDHIKPNILARYAMFQRPTNGLSNVITDSFMPKLMYQYNFDFNKILDKANLPSTAVVISPWFANLFQIKQIKIEQMLRIIGYTKKDIKNLLIKVKRRELEMLFVGYGGTNVNTIHWLTEMCTLTHTIKLFKTVTVMEPDTLETSNLLRFPKDPEALKSTEYIRINKNSKLNLLTNYELKTLSRMKPEITNSRLRDFNIRSYVKEDTVIYGAPSLGTRDMLSRQNVRFISATHAGNTAYLHLNPTQDTDIQVETYGLIQLSVFFMNQLKLAAGLLETLANEEINLHEKDIELMNYTFSQKDSLTTDRQYNFQLDHDGLMMDEETANAII